MRTTHRLVVWLVISALLSFSGRAWGRHVAITTTGGTNITGEFVGEDQSSVTVRVAGINTPVPRADIKEMRDVLTPEEQYTQRRTVLKDDDIDGHLKLARALCDEKQFDLAKRELDDLRQRAPGNDDVTLLVRVVADELARRTTARATAPSPRPIPTPVVGAGGVPLPTRLLSDVDVNLIKIWELVFHTSPPPRVVVPRSVLDTLFRNYPDDPAAPNGLDDQNALRAAEGWQQLRVLFDVAGERKDKVRDFYRRIVVRDDPPALLTFKTKIYRNYVLGYCGTANCHGGPNAKGLFLFNKDRDRDQTAYTNFYILCQSRNRQAAVVDRDKPENSLLIQYGMAAVNAVFPHPQVPGWRPAFTDESAPVPRTIYGWVRRQLRHRDWDYPVEYELPTPWLPAAPPGPATRPAGSGGERPALP